MIKKPKNLAEEIQQSKPFKSIEIELYLNLIKTYESLNHEFFQLFKKNGITESQYNVMRIILGSGSGGIPMQKIGERMLARDPDVTRLVDRLERSKLVKRERSSQDRRVIFILLTPTGKKLLDKLNHPILKIHDHQLSHMSKAKMKKLNELLFEARHGK